MGPQTEALDEEDRLVLAFRLGEADAADAMYSRFAPLIYGVGLRTFGDAERAGRLVEKTFARLWQRAPHYRSASTSLQRWVLHHAVGVSMQMSHGADVGVAGGVGRVRMPSLRVVGR